MRPFASASILPVALALVAGVSGSSERTFGRWALELEGEVRSARSTCDETGCRTFLLVAEGGAGSGEEGDEAPVDGDAVEGQAGDEGRPLSLVLVTTPLEGPAQQTVLGTGLPSEAGRMAFCRGPSPGDLLVMFQAGGSVYFVDPDYRLGTLEGTRVGSERWSAPAQPWTDDCSELVLVGPGEAWLVRLAGTGTRRSVLSVTELPLPMGVRRNGAGLTFETPTVQSVMSARGEGAAGKLLVVGPRSYDDLRLESVVFEPMAEVRSWLERGGMQESSEELEEGLALRGWSRLPGHESVMESRYVDLHGGVVLVAVTQEADKVGLLERKKLRLFLVESDRTRSGRPPIFQVRSASRLWQRLDIRFHDMNGDGLEDLILVQPEGLSGRPLLVDVFVASGPHRFAEKPERSVLDTGQAWWTLEEDWNGDQLPDVLVREGATVQVHLTLPAGTSGASHGIAGWSRDPSLRFELSGSGEGDVVGRRSWSDAGLLVIATTTEDEETEELSTTVELLRPPGPPSGGDRP